MSQQGNKQLDFEMFIGILCQGGYKIYPLEENNTPQPEIPFGYKGFPVLVAAHHDGQPNKIRILAQNEQDKDFYFLYYQLNNSQWTFIGRAR